MSFMWLRSDTETTSMGKNTTGGQGGEDGAQLSLESTNAKVTVRTCPTAGRTAGGNPPSSSGESPFELRNPF